MESFARRFNKYKKLTTSKNKLRIFFMVVCFYVRSLCCYSLAGCNTRCMYCIMFGAIFSLKHVCETCLRNIMWSRQRTTQTVSRFTSCLFCSLMATDSTVRTGTLCASRRRFVWCLILLLTFLLQVMCHAVMALTHAGPRPRSGTIKAKVKAVPQCKGLKVKHKETNSFEWPCERLSK